MQQVEAELLLEGLKSGAAGVITAVVTDSRKIEPGCVFVCFEGARADGHDFAAKAVEQGAAYIVGLHPVEGVPEDQMIVVKDSALAMVKMAANYRRVIAPRMIGVTGSVGKTTTKEFCAAVLQAFGETVKTEGNQNNDIGMPNTLFRMTEQTEFAVVEMGMSHLEEIRRLATAARPGAGIITCIGVSHIANLGSRENIRKAKLEICDGLPDGAPLVLNYDDDMLRVAELPNRLKPVWVSLQDKEADIYAADIVSAPGVERFTLCDKANGRFEVEIPVEGLHNIRDAMQAYAAAVGLGLDAARAAEALGDYKSTGLRWHKVQRFGLTVIEDCYNASPDSMKASLETFRNTKAERHIALLGDMLELGAFSEKAHRDLGVLAAETKMDRLFCFGEAAAYTARTAEQEGVSSAHFDTQENAALALYEELRPGDALLVKGSRGMRLENIVEMLWQYCENNAEKPE